MKISSPLKWHGGKHYLAKWIIANMPPHLHYVEPFFGGGSVLLARDPTRDWFAENGEKLPAEYRGSSEVVNDLYGELTNFFRVLQDPADFELFVRQVELMPFSAVEFSAAAVEDAGDDQVTRAVKFFIRARQSRQGLMKDFATLSRNRTRSRMNEQVSAWLNAIDGLEDIHRRLRSVVILNNHACQIIQQQDDKHTLFYCDPPYLHETRIATSTYACEMDVAAHEELLEVLSGITGKFLLSGYPSALYDQAAEKYGWHRHEKVIDNKSSSQKQKPKKLECLWTNYESGGHESAPENPKQSNDRPENPSDQGELF